MMKHYLKILFAIILALCINSGMSTYVKSCQTHPDLASNSCIPVLQPPNISCEVCDSTAFDRLAICNINRIELELPLIISHLPEDILGLIIHFNNAWQEKTYVDPIQVNISGISRFQTLMFFQMKGINGYSTNTYYLQGGSLLNNSNIAKFIINLPIDSDNLSISSTVESLNKFTKLTFLDVSFIRVLGFNGLHRIIKQHVSEIETLCFANIQFPGSKIYQAEISSLLNEVSFQNVYPNLAEIDASYNAIAHILPEISSVAPNLKILDISNNFITAISNTAAILEFILHPTLEVLNLNQQGYNHPMIDPQNNEYSQTYETIEVNHQSLMNKVSSVVSCVNSVSNGNMSNIASNSKAFCNILICSWPHLFVDIDCSRQNFLPLPSAVINGKCFGNLEIPIGKKLKVIYFSNIHLEQLPFIYNFSQGAFCVNNENTLEMIDLSDNRWMKQYAFMSMLRKLTGITGMEHLKALHLKSNKLKLNSINHKFDGNYTALSDLDLSGNFIENVSFCSVAANLRSLVLKNTFTSDRIDIRHCLNLESIDLSFNGLNDLSVNTINNMEYLKLINISNNNIYTLEKEWIDYFANHKDVRMDLTGNPLLCNCSKQSKVFIKWIIQMQKAFNGFDLYQCSGLMGALPIHQINVGTFWQSCRGRSEQIALYSVISAIVTVITLIVIYTFYKCYWRIKYSIQRSKLPRTQSNYQYDCFVSYCSEDRFWVHSVLIKEIEEKYGFRLCIHYRDFLVGASITDTIVSSISESNKIILIISSISLTNSWCQFEMEIAINQSLNKKKELILIILGNISSSDLSPTVAYLLDMDKVLQWPEVSNQQKHFWTKIVAYLYNSEHETCLPMLPYQCCRTDVYTTLEDTHVEETSVDLEGYLEQDLQSDLKVHFKKANEAKKKADEADTAATKLQRCIDQKDIRLWIRKMNSDPIYIKFMMEHKQVFDEQDSEYTLAKMHVILSSILHYKEENAKVYTKEMQHVKEASSRI